MISEGSRGRVCKLGVVGWRMDVIAVVFRYDVLIELISAS